MGTVNIHVANWTASFRDDVLDECTEFSITVEVRPDVVAKRFAEASADGGTAVNTDGGLALPPSSVADLQSRLQKYLAQLQAELLTDTDFKTVALKRPCSEQFKDRVVLASCRFSQALEDVPSLVTGTFQGISNNYAFALVDEDDLRMKNCLEMGGDWQALDRDSPEYRRERIKHHAAKVQETGDALERLMKESN